MAFLRTSLVSEPTPVLRGSGLLVRPLSMGDYAAWAELRANSRAHLTPWEPTWSSDELTRSAFRRRVRINQRDMREDQGIAFLIFRQDEAALVGGLSLSNIRRGAAQSASIGYWIGLPFVGRGCMTDAVGLALAHAFDAMGLHRVEAACMPGNLASMRVLEKCGFRREGVAAGYLRINDVWQDHNLLAITEDSWRQQHRIRAAAFRPAGIIAVGDA